MSSGAQWPGYSARQCPVCGQAVGTHREPINDERRELVVYHQHDDTVGQPCRMQVAAIRAVAFTGTRPAAGAA